MSTMPFEKQIFCAFRDVGLYEIKKEKMGSFKEKVLGTVSNIKHWGIEGIELSKDLYEDVTGPELYLSYTEIMDVDGESYYVFDKQKDLDEFIKLCSACTNATPVILKKWKQVQGKPEEHLYFKIGDRANIKKDVCSNLLKMKDLNIIIWLVLPHKMKAIMDANPSALSNIFSSKYELKKNKSYQVKYNEFFSDKFELDNDICLKLDESKELVQEQVSLWNKILYNITYDKVVQVLGNAGDYDKIIKEYREFVSQGNEKICEYEEVENKANIVQAGIKGEKEVEYILNWLPEEFCVIERGDDGIFLKCAKVSDEIQEIDHIVLSPEGVFAIETKNYSGSIEIDKQGNWMRKKAKGDKIGIENPIGQVQRHHRIIENILGIKDIFDIICIANEKAIIYGAENSPIPVLKSDMLAYYITNYKNPRGKHYREEDIEYFKQQINVHRLMKK